MTDTDAARIIAALVYGDLSGLHRADGITFCAYCVNGEVLRDGDPFDHAPGCPILAGRAWLEAHEAEAGDG